MFLMIDRIRRFLLGFDPDDIQAKLTVVESKLEESSKILQSLKEELDKLKESKADMRYVQSIEEQLSNLDNLINNIFDILKMKREIKKGRIELSNMDKCGIVLNLIQKGINTSSELRKYVPFSVRELYEVLNELEKLSIIGQIKEGRKKKYYVIEDDSEFVQSEDYL